MGFPYRLGDTIHRPRSRDRANFRFRYGLFGLLECRNIPLVWYFGVSLMLVCIYSWFCSLGLHLRLFVWESFSLYLTLKKVLAEDISKSNQTLLRRTSFSPFSHIAEFGFDYSWHASNVPRIVKKSESSKPAEHEPEPLSKLNFIHSPAE